MSPIPPGPDARAGGGRGMIASLALRSYLALPLALRQAVPAGFRLRMRRKLLPLAFARARRKRPGAAEVARLDGLLWGGYSRLALAGLASFCDNPEHPGRDRAEAAWALARWYGAQGDAAQAHAQLLRLQAADPGRAMRLRPLEADCLRQLGRIEAAQAVIAAALAARPYSPDLFLVMANCVLSGEPAGAAADASRLAWLNRIYEGRGIAPLRLADPSKAFTIDNLAADAPLVTEADLGRPLPKVSVLMPVYAAAETLPFALRGLLAQTWTNLEVIVVDDMSPDDTVAVAEAIAAKDPRVTVLRQPRNQGSYAARNAGLRAASGDYITTHDADDWSHPQKIEQQVRHLMADPAAIACSSCWIRCDSDMSFRGLYRPWGGLISKSVSSLMFPRAVMETLGGWVEVRVGADTELMRRAEAVFGPDCLQRIAFSGPLAFSLHEERSLTRQSATHVRTVYHGVRKELQDAAQHWHRTADRAALTLDPRRNPRPFPVPATILPDRPEAVACDLLVIGDFALAGVAAAFGDIRAAAGAAGGAVAIFHWRRPELDAGAPVQAALRDEAQAGRLRIVAPGERVRAATVIVGDPALLCELPDLLPAIETRQLVVVADPAALPPPCDPERLRAHCRTAFGTEGRWVPAAGALEAI